MKDLRFTKEHIYCDFDDSQSDENIKSGESLGVIMGKIKRFFEKFKTNQEKCELEHKIIYDSLGMKKKNWIKMPDAGVLRFPNDYDYKYVANEDGSLTISGYSEASSTYVISKIVLPENTDFILSGFKLDGPGENCLYLEFHDPDSPYPSHPKYHRDYGNGVIFNTGTITNYQLKVHLTYHNSAFYSEPRNLTIYPMLRRVGTDDVYEPGIDDLQTQINNVNVVNTITAASIGIYRKNLLKNTAGTSTQNGITFTYNSDGSVTCNGTATADTNYRYIITLPENTSFTLSGCPAGGSTSTYNLFAMDADTWSKIHRHTDATGEVTFNTGSCKTWHFIIRIVNGQTVSNLTFYPMLRNAAIPDNTYEPYVDDLQTQVNDLRAQLAAHIGTGTANKEDL